MSKVNNIEENKTTNNVADENNTNDVDKVNNDGEENKTTNNVADENNANDVDKVNNSNEDNKTNKIKKYRALTSFAGIVTMAKDEVKELSDKDVVKDLIKAKFIKEEK